MYVEPPAAQRSGIARQHPRSAPIHSSQPSCANAHIAHPLQLMKDVSLGSASRHRHSAAAKRRKLVTELTKVRDDVGRRCNKAPHTLYVLDEPTVRTAHGGPCVADSVGATCGDRCTTPATTRRSDSTVCAVPELRDRLRGQRGVPAHPRRSQGRPGLLPHGVPHRIDGSFDRQVDAPGLCGAGTVGHIDVGAVAAAPVVRLDDTG